MQVTAWEKTEADIAKRGGGEEMDLVVGATGVVGQKTAVDLRRRGRQVRAMVRGGISRAEATPLRQAGIEIIDGDLTRPETLERCCAGIETVVTTATSMPHGRDDGLRRVDHDGALALIEAAQRAGVRRFVYVSYSTNIREDSPLERAKRDCEDRLLAGKKMQAVVLRPSYFMEVWLSPMLGFDPANGRARIYGDGERPVSYISFANVAEFAVATAMSSETSSLILELGGPAPLSQLEVARIFESKGNRRLEKEFIPLSALRAQHAAATDGLQKTFAALMIGYAQGDPVAESKTNAARYGIRLRSLEEYAEASAGG